MAPNPEQVEFCRQQLDTHLTLQRIHASFRVKRDQSKTDVLESLVQGLLKGTIDPDYALRIICDSPRRWFTVLRCEGFVPPKDLQKPDALLWTGLNGWYGPVVDGDVRWYIFQKVIIETITDESGASTDVDEDEEESDDSEVEEASDDVRVVRRRHLFRVFVEVHPNHVALHWDNFSTTRAGELDDKLGSKYWKRIQRIIEDFQLLNKEMTPVDAFELIMNGLWDLFRRDQAYEWKDIASRTMQSGVLVNARSGIDRTHTGLTELASRLARTALAAANQATPANIALAQRALLETLIRDGGARSYELELRKKTEERPLLKLHAHFGTQLKSGQDSLVHFKTWLRHGGSIAALGFLRATLPNSF